MCLWSLLSYPSMCMSFYLSDAQKQDVSFMYSLIFPWKKCRRCFLMVQTACISVLHSSQPSGIISKWTSACKGKMLKFPGLKASVSVRPIDHDIFLLVWHLLQWPSSCSTSLSIEWPLFPFIYQILRTLLYTISF